MVLLRIALPLLLAACKLPAPECSIRCSEGCSFGLTCGQDGYCHGDGKVTGCTSSNGDGGGSCVGCVSGQYNYVFVTSTTYVPGTFGSHGMSALDYADSECNRLARAAKTPLGGTFKAWLSTSTVNARDRLIRSDGKIARGWIRADWRPFIDSLDTFLGQGQMFYPAWLDENGSNLVSEGGAFVSVATGTQSDGTVVPDDTAGDWSSPSSGFMAGVAGAADRRWTYATTDTGGSEAHLYCFGIDLAQPLGIPKATGRTAFLSATLFSPTSGPRAADTICSDEAAANLLSGTYHALLATSTRSASSLFDLTKPTWVRVDGVAWLAQASDLNVRSPLSALNLTASGGYSDNTLVWTGSPSPSQASTTPAQSCSDWTSATSMSGIVGSAELPFVFFKIDDKENGYPRACTNMANLYCLQY